MSGLRTFRDFSRWGGLVLNPAGGGTVFGANRRSGAPGGEGDDACARAGIKAIADAIESNPSIEPTATGKRVAAAQVER